MKTAEIKSTSTNYETIEVLVIKPTRKNLLDATVGIPVFCVKDDEDTAKATASQLKRKGLAQFKTKSTDTGIYLTRIQ